MKPPARPWRGAASGKIETKDVTARSSSIAGNPRPYPAHVEPNWHHIGTVVDSLLASLNKDTQL